MASRKHEKQAARAARDVAEAERRARRRERGIYVGLAVLLVALAIVAATSLGSSHGPTQGPPVLQQPNGVPSSQIVAATQLAGGIPVAPGAAATELAANERQANQVLTADVQAKVASLKGLPVVINQWASWCPNCRFEFPFFQVASRTLAGKVAFVGLDSQDSQGNAQAFLRRHPVDYPSVFDPSAQQALSLGAGQGWPTTIILNAKHQITTVHEGAYQSLQALLQDITSHV